eukprot:g30756.t1
MASKFTDEAKIGVVVDSQEGYLRVQWDLDQMSRWTEEWQMEFNLDKCEVLHFGKANQGRTYTLNGKVLGSVAEQKDFGVQVHNSLKVESQVDRIMKQAFGMLVFINQCIEYRSCKVMLQLYRTLFRPLLKYCIQFWSLCYRKDIVKLERVQKRFTRMSPGLEGLSYRERLNRLGLYSLERRRLRGDLIEVYKIMSNMDWVNSQGLFPRSPKLEGISL